MAEKNFQSSKQRKWMPFVILLALLGLASVTIFLVPMLAGSSRAVQTTKSTNANPYPVRTAPPPPTCAASVKVDKTLANGYQATVTVKNTSSETLNTWMIYWSLPTGVSFVKGWNANVFQDGDVIMAHPFSTNRTFPAGGTMVVGFEATGLANQPALNVTLNGIPCTS